MPELIEGPEGLIRVAEEMGEATYSDVMVAVPRGQEVELLFVRRILDLSGVDVGVVYEAVARVFMALSNYERVVEMLPKGLRAWREQGV